MPASKLPHLSREMTDGHLPVAPGIELAYLDRGSGPALVFVPGWTFAKEIFENIVNFVKQAIGIRQSPSASQSPSPSPGGF